MIINPEDVYLVGIDDMASMDTYCGAAIIILFILCALRKLRLQLLFDILHPFMWGSLWLSTEYGVLVDTHVFWKTLIWVMLAFSSLSLLSYLWSIFLLKRGVASKSQYQAKGHSQRAESSDLVK